MFLFRMSTGLNFKADGTSYQGNVLMPVLKWRSEPFKARQLVQILLREFESDVLCDIPPHNVAHNVAFLLDTLKMKHIDDIKCDSMGAWKRTGTPR